MTRLLLIVGVLLLLAAPVSAACINQSASGELTSILTWTNVMTSGSVNILRSTASGAETKLMTVPFGTTYTDTVPMPTAQISYFYQVQGVTSGGQLSDLSNEVCKTFFPKPAAPTNLLVK